MDWNQARVREIPNPASFFNQAKVVKNSVLTLKQYRKMCQLNKKNLFERNFIKLFNKTINLPAKSRIVEVYWWKTALFNPQVHTKFWLQKIQANNTKFPEQLCLRSMD